MSRQYHTSQEVPTDVLISRLRELALTIPKGPDAVQRAFVMRVPIEVDYDPDCVMMEAARRLAALEAVRDLAQHIFDAWQEHGLLTWSDAHALSIALARLKAPSEPTP